MAVRWNFYKIYIRSPDETFERRIEVLSERFENPSQYTLVSRGRTYTYDLSDVDVAVDTTTSTRPIIIGNILRSPKLARGRARDAGGRTSKKASVDVAELSDSTEFIYDRDTCVLSLRTRDPFGPTRTTVQAWIHLLGHPTDNPIEPFDVHVDLLRDTQFTDDLFDRPGDLKLVSLHIARNNPGPDHEAFDAINFGLVLDEVDGDAADYVLKRTTPGSLDKARGGLIRRTIRWVVSRGYLKKGTVKIDNQKVDLKGRSSPTARETVYDGRSETGSDDTLATQAETWMRQLKSDDNSDIFTPIAKDESRTESEP